MDFPDLPDPQAMFDIHYFRFDRMSKSILPIRCSSSNHCIVSPRRDPRPFFKFAREIYPGQFSPSPCHRFIAALESGKKLLRNYTQNIDTLEQEAGISKVASIFFNLAC